ncbi:ankyrin repeat-containing domain protein [Chytriomyces cf. hyalinus JEL632]|nr:ankyrin repeat-containing domain protein [Chytriomyces cf. hyalinus JEL632]
MTALPIELWVSITIHSVSSTASLSQFAQVTSLFKALRQETWSSPAVHAQIIKAAFGSDLAMIALLKEPVIPGFPVRHMLAMDIDDEDCAEDDDEDDDYDGGSDNDEAAAAAAAAVKMLVKPQKTWLQFYSYFEMDCSSLFKSLIRCGASFDALESSALRLACKREDGECIVLALLDAGASSLEARRKLIGVREDEAFREACRLKNIGTMQLLMHAGANVHARADEALRFAASLGNSEVVAFLIENGASVSALNNAPLFGAIEMCNDSVCLQLLAAGASPNIPMHGVPSGKSPLQAAACVGSTAVVEALISYGADVHYENSIAKREAIRRNEWNIVKILEQAEH